jgi:hypothetical protein
MRRLLIVWLIILVGFGCSKPAFLKNDWGADRIEQGMSQLEIFMAKFQLTSTQHIQTAVAIPIGQHLAIVPTHAVIPTLLVELPLRKGFGIIIFKAEDSEFLIGNSKTELLGARADVALMSYQGNKKFPFPMGDSDQLELGDKLLILVCPQSTAFTAKVAIVGRLKPSQREYQDILKQKVSDEPVPQEMIFVLDRPIAAGDSGAPVLAWQDRKLKWVGNVFATSSTNAYAVKIDFVREAVDELLRDSLSGGD